MKVFETIQYISPLFESIFLPFVEKIRLRTSKIYNLWTSISIFFLNCAFFAIICITNTRSSTNHTSSLVCSIVTFITDSHQSARPHIRVTNNTFSITFFTQTTNSNSWLLSTHNQIRMMFCKSLVLLNIE